MSIGVGTYSVIVAVPAVMIAIVGCLLIAAMSLFRADSACGRIHGICGGEDAAVVLREWVR
jgi:hypothetical protein